jgi:hypothetical protein
MRPGYAVDLIGPSSSHGRVLKDADAARDRQIINGVSLFVSA